MGSRAVQPESHSPVKQVSEVFVYFFRLGVFGFGGPLALIAQMQRELAEERKWISEEEFRRAFALIKAMPGTVAVQMAIYISRRRAGRFAGFVGGLALIIPSFAMMILLAQTYNEFIESPQMVIFFEGIQMAALALIFYSLRALTTPYWRISRFWVLLVIGLILTAWQSVPEYLLILVLGSWAIVWDRKAVPNKLNSVLLPLFLVCLRAGAFIFGTGFAIIPALQSNFVTIHQWATVTEFKDALAFGQMTPGPVVITVTFLGYKIAGFMGALVATIGVFLPAFFHQLVWFPRAMRKLESFTWLNAFLLGAIAAVGAGILFVVVQMTKGISPYQALIFVASLALLMKVKINPALLILLAGGASLAPHLF